MMELILAFLAGLFLNWWAFGFLCLLILLFEHNELYILSGWGAALLAAIAFFFFNLTWATVWPLIVAYIPIGLAWSFVRWIKHCNKIVEEYKDQTIGGYEAAEVERNLNVTHNISKLSYWTCLWPFSFIESFIGDFIDAIEAFIKKISKWTFERVANNARNKLTFESDKHKMDI